MTKQIRNIGSYEIVIYDSSDHRVKEVVIDSSLYEARKLANTLTTPDTSYTIAKIVDNSKYSVWAPTSKG